MTIAGSEAAVRIDAIKTRLAPVLDTFDDTMRRGRRAMLRRQHAAEDAVAAATLKIRRQPLRATAIAAGTGAIVGVLLGVGLGSLGRHRTS